MARHFSSRTERGGRRTAGMAHAGSFVSVRSGGRNGLPCMPCGLRQVVAEFREPPQIV